MRKGALDLSLYPLPYAGRRSAGMQHRSDARPREFLRSGPCVEEQAGRQAAHRLSRGKRHQRSSAGCGRRAAVASREKPLVSPSDAKGMKVPRRLARDGHGAAGPRAPRCCRCRRTNFMPRCRPAPAMPASRPPRVSSRSASRKSRSSSPPAAARATGSCWSRLLMSKSIFRRPAEEPAGRDRFRRSRNGEVRARRARKRDDIKVAEVYKKVGARCTALVEKWRAIARDTAWKDYAGKTELSAALMKSAQEVTA